MVNGLGGNDMLTKHSDDNKSKDISPIDIQGIPTTYLSYLILDLMFSERNRWFTADQIAKFFAAKSSDAHAICDGLKYADFLIEDDSTPSIYKYNLHCRDAERQARLEKFLLEVELENFSVHSILPYSPSFP
jgi:hypothetical protein